MSKSGLKKNKLSSWASKSHDDTYHCGYELAAILPSDCIVCIKGDLGAGKTTLCKGLINKLTGTLASEILSPTYTYVRTYSQGSTNLHHFDCYRLNSEDDFLELGLEDLLNEKGIKLIEWPDRIKDLLPKNVYSINIDYKGETARHITLQGTF